jgi:hypothetical protein
MANLAAECPEQALDRAEREAVRHAGPPADPPSENGVRSAQRMQVGPRTPVGTHLEKAEVGPASGPTRRLAHFGRILATIREAGMLTTCVESFRSRLVYSIWRIASEIYEAASE